MALFWSTLGMVFLAEMGDKTQILMVAMASKYKVRAILPGVALAVLVLNALAVGLGTLTGRFLPGNLIGLVAGCAFLYFAWAAIGGGNGEEASGDRGKPRFAVLSVALTFFLAELGDKTQLTALTVAAEHDPSEALTLFFAASIGLYAADVLGFLVGWLLGREIPARYFAGGSFLLFCVFGLLRIHNSLYTVTDTGGVEGLLASAPHGRGAAILIVFCVAVVFLLLCVRRLRAGVKTAAA